MDGIADDMRIGPGTDVIAGEGKILTAGAIDSHVHFLSGAEMHEAIATGITTVLGGGTGPTEGSKATTVTPGRHSLAMMHRALDRFPLNVVLFGKGNTVSPEALDLEAEGGAGGYKVHEDWGATPAAIDTCLKAADRQGLQVALHADSLNETGFVGDTLNAIAGRSIHIFHSEGAGGGHAPDIITVAGEDYVLPASTNPTLPFTVNTVAEHLDMLMAAHHLNPKIPEDLAFAESRIRASTMGAEDLLQDMGAISITSSDALAMGRIGELICRTWQVAHVMKGRYGSCGTTLPADNERARRYVAKYTICPAVAHGIDYDIGSVESGKRADLVLWDPAFFGIRPAAVIKSGAIVAAPMGDPNGAVPGPQPVLIRPALAGEPSSAAKLATSYVAKSALDDGLGERLGLGRQLSEVKSTREVFKSAMPNNSATPDVKVDPDTFVVTVEGELVYPEPVDEVPLAQRYLMF